LFVWKTGLETNLFVWKTNVDVGVSESIQVNNWVEQQ